MQRLRCDACGQLDRQSASGRTVVGDNSGELGSGAHEWVLRSGVSIGEEPTQSRGRFGSEETAVLRALFPKPDIEPSARLQASLQVVVPGHLAVLLTLPGM